MKLFLFLLSALITAQKLETCNHNTYVFKSAHTSSTTATTDISPDSATRQILYYTNLERQKAGLAPLTISKKLMNTAANYAKIMAEQGDLSHGINGQTLPMRYAAIDYTWKFCGENIAANMALNGESTVEDQWMQSSGHKANILSANFTEIGIGIAYSGKLGRYYYCQDFGQPK